MGTSDRCFVMDFFIKLLVFQQNCCIWRIFLLVTTTSELEQPQWQWRKGKNKKAMGEMCTCPQKLWTWSTLFGIFHCHYCMTKIVKHDRNGNAMVGLVPEIIIITVSWKTIDASLISSEVPVERLFNHIGGHFFLFCCAQLRGCWSIETVGLTKCGIFNAVTYWGEWGGGDFRGATLIFQTFCNWHISSATLSLGKQLILMDLNWFIIRCGNSNSEHKQIFNHHNTDFQGRCRVDNPASWSTQESSIWCAIPTSPPRVENCCYSQDGVWKSKQG